MALLRTVDATTEPLTTAEAKTHLRVTISADDAYIDALVKACRQTAEKELRRSLITQTWERTLDAFPTTANAEIRLDMPPVIAITSVKYLESVAGTLLTLNATSYTLDSKSEPGWLVPAYGYVWPDTYATINAVTVTYTAGYGAAAADVPQAIKQWILVHVGHYYENREATMPGVSITPLPFVGGLLDGYRVVTF